MLTRVEKRNNDVVRPKKVTPVRISTAAAAGSVLTITFDQAVALKGVPQYTTDVVGADPLSAVLTNPTTVAITFDAAIAAANEVRIPFQDPGIRSKVGGFVADTTFPV